MTGVKSIYNDIAARTGGDIYIGVVGPVRTGKSTLIRRFMEQTVIPNIDDEYRRERATDELPQASAGRTIMTAEPKFIPESAVEVSMADNAVFNVRMVDCVGYIVPSALGYIENDTPRMVKTPWFEDEIPFNMAAEIGTKKVITEHSTIGLVVTTDGSISEIPRDEYQKAEERVINELKELNKPFIVLLNCVFPESSGALELSEKLTERYEVPVKPINAEQLTGEEINDILSEILLEFPVKEVSIDLPGWINSLPCDHQVRKGVYSAVREEAVKLRHVRDINAFVKALSGAENISSANIISMELSTGSARIKAAMDAGLFFRILGEQTGIIADDEQELLQKMSELAETKRKYERIRTALDEVEATGYGIVMPTLDELSLEEPEIMKQGGRYGVRLRASAPSIHMMRADIQTEVAPIVGSESQSEELIMYLLKEFEEDPRKIWESNIFGKSLHELVNEGLHNKLYRMPSDARSKMQETLEKIINEGCSGLICIIL